METANKNVRDLQAQHADVLCAMKVHKWWYNQSSAISKEGINKKHVTDVGVTSRSEGVIQ